MALTYGFLKCKVLSDPVLKGSRHKHAIQYHLLSFESLLKVTCGIGMSRSTQAPMMPMTCLNTSWYLIFSTRYSTHARRADRLPWTDVQKCIARSRFSPQQPVGRNGPLRISDMMDGSGGTEPAASSQLEVARRIEHDARYFKLSEAYSCGENRTPSV